MRATVGELRKLIREEHDYVRVLCELSGGEGFSELLDNVMQDLAGANKKVEQAHQLAPAGTAKAIVAGLHSDLFNKISEFRGYVAQLKKLAQG
jgi:hypothetical protein